MRLLFALPGFHAQERGAEVALLAVAQELASGGETVTVMGSGPPRAGMAYHYRRVSAIGRDRFEGFPRVPPFRSETAWEDATFALAMLARYRPRDYDVAVTCNFPFTHWALRRPGAGPAPLQIFVTQNGDWPAQSDKAEFRLFRCDGLVCTNPDYEARNRDLWPTVLAPNGIDPTRYEAVQPDRERFGLPVTGAVVLMVSALIPSKRVLEGMQAVAQIPGAFLVVAGDGPLRGEVDALAKRLLPGRFSRITLPPREMPVLYASADAFLHMSLEESFGNVFVEAMASGLPIVAQDTARVEWIVGRRRTLCDTRDDVALVTALKAALATGIGAADPRVEEFTWSRIAARYRAFFVELLDRRRAAGRAA